MPKTKSKRNMNPEEFKLFLSPLIHRLLFKHDRSVEPSPSLVSEFEQDSGSGPSPSCLLRAGPSGPSGPAEVPTAPARSVWRWRGGEKFRRPTGGQENLRASCWHQQRHSGHLYQPGDCRRAPTTSARDTPDGNLCKFWLNKYRFIQSKEGWFDVSFRI